MQFGTVTLIGRTNVGKSTFLNRVLGEPLAITSPLPQTTRDALLGVMQYEDAQVAFMDTPGVHRPHSELGRRMNGAAYDSARSADVVVMVTDPWLKKPRTPGQDAWTDPGEKSPLDSPWIRPGDKELLISLATHGQASVLLINKVDLAKDKSRLLPMLEAYSRAHTFSALIPMSLRRDQGVEEALREITRLLPEGPPGYDAETLTNRPVLFFVREYVREAVLNQLTKEVPHAVAVSIDHAEETERLLRIGATIHVEKVGQRKIVVGHGGERIKALGIASRERIEKLVGKKVHLELFVRVTPEWKDMPRQLAELGYDASSSVPDWRGEPDS